MPKRAKVSKGSALLLGIVLVVAVLLIAFEPQVRAIVRGKSRLAPYPYSVAGSTDVSRSIAALEERIKKLPNEALDRAALAGAYLARARTRGSAADYELAEKMAEGSLRLLPFSNSGAKLVLARVAEARHEFTKSISLAKDVLREDAKGEALALIATSNLALGNLEEASRAADVLVSEKPTLGNHSLRALVLLAQGRDDEAEFDFKKGIALEDQGELPESTRVRCLFARHFLNRGKLAEAEDLIEEALRISPGFHLALNLRGELEMARRKFQKAEKTFLEAFSSSRQLVYFRNYGKAKFRQGNTAGAREVWKEAEGLLRDELRAVGFGHRLELAQLLLDRGSEKDLPEALALAEAETRLRQSADALRILARAQFKAGKVKEAKDTLMRIARSGVKDAESLSLASEVEASLGNRDRAQFYADYAKKINPKIH